ncbi:MAG: phage major tail tube protein [Desulfovibrio sp.]|jgi:P2 family phage contractile tail tube protein|nr:phage major tail tube protein [Desulfovibrio sp.]
MPEEKITRTVNLYRQASVLFNLFGFQIKIASCNFYLESEFDHTRGIQRQGENAQAVAVPLRGGWKKIDSGTWKPGDKSMLKVSVAVSYSGGPGVRPTRPTFADNRPGNV